ncbi:MAG: CrcB family protein [Myxococcota bacterium]
MFLTLTLVFLGGGLGASLRWAVGLVVPGWWGVLVANIVGSLLLGVLLGSPWAQDRTAVAFLGTGLMGGFTTYSTFNLNVVDAIGRQAWAEVALQVCLTLVACLVGGAVGVWLGGQFGAGISPGSAM